MCSLVPGGMTSLFSRIRWLTGKTSYHGSLGSTDHWELDKDVNTVKRHVDDYLNSQLSASVRPHDAVSALGPMYEAYEIIGDQIEVKQQCSQLIQWPDKHGFVELMEKKVFDMKEELENYQLITKALELEVQALTRRFLAVANAADVVITEETNVERGKSHVSRQLDDRDTDLYEAKTTQRVLKPRKHIQRERSLFSRQSFAVPVNRSSNNGAANEYHNSSSTASPLHLAGHHWTVQLHVDAAFLSSRCTYSIVISDVNDVYIEALSGSATTSSTLATEVSAILEALRILSRRRFITAHIKSDSLLAVTYLHAAPCSWPWRLTRLLSDCLTL